MTERTIEITITDHDMFRNIKMSTSDEMGFHELVGILEAAKLTHLHRGYEEAKDKLAERHFRNAVDGIGNGLDAIKRHLALLKSMAVESKEYEFGAGLRELEKKLFKEDGNS